MSPSFKDVVFGSQSLPRHAYHESPNEQFEGNREHKPNPANEKQFQPVVFGDNGSNVTFTI